MGLRPEGIGRAARAAGLDKGMVSRWVAKRHLLWEMHQHDQRRRHLGRPGRTPFYPEMERQLVDWARAQPGPVTRTAVLRQARTLLDVRRRLGSKWLAAFHRRNQG